MIIINLLFNMPLQHIVFAFLQVIRLPYAENSKYQ